MEKQEHWVSAKIIWFLYKKSVFVGILVIHFPYLKHEKTVFIYINIFLLGPLLIKTPRSLILDTFVGPSPTIRFAPLPSLICHWMFLKIGVFLVINGCGKKKRNVRFLVWCAGMVVCGCLLVVSGGLLVVCDRLWSFAGGLWSFMVVACFNNHEVKRFIEKYLFWKFRSSHWRCFVKKCFLRNFAKFTGKHLCKSLTCVWDRQLY